jgi:hypothetical protein
MITTKENLTAVKFLQDKIKKGDSSISTKELDKISVDKCQLNQQFRNILLKKDFLGDWVIKLIDENSDLDGIPIVENKKLITRLKALWGNGIKEMKFSELMSMNIFPPATSLKILNFKLTNNPFLLFKTDYCDITLIDESKNIDGHWLDSMISKARILEVLKEFNIKSKDLTEISELDLNKLLETHFKKYFENLKRGGASNKGLIDLIIGNSVYGIELKLARELKKTTQADRALGQIHRYTDQFGTKFMVIIAGNEEDMREKCVQELIEKIKKRKCAYYYLGSND